MLPWLLRPPTLLTRPRPHTTGGGRLGPATSGPPLTPRCKAMVRSVVTVHRSLRSHSPVVDEEGSCSFLLFFPVRCLSLVSFLPLTLRHQQVDPLQAVLSCNVLLCVCVCGGRGTGSPSGAAAVLAIPLSPQTQEAPFPPEAAVFLRQARGAAEGAAHAG